MTQLVWQTPRPAIDLAIDSLTITGCWQPDFEHFQATGAALVLTSRF
jgi:hypothetical protein